MVLIRTAWITRRASRGSAKPSWCYLILKDNLLFFVLYRDYYRLLQGLSVSQNIHSYSCYVTLPPLRISLASILTPLLRAMFGSRAATTKCDGNPWRQRQRVDLLSQQVFEARVQFNVVFTQVAEQLVRPQDLGNSNQLENNNNNNRDSNSVYHKSLRRLLASMLSLCAEFYLSSLSELDSASTC